MRVGEGFDRWSGDPPGTCWSKWFGGILFPIFFVALAVSIWHSGHATMIGRNGSMTLSGDAAIGMGFLYLSIAIFSYCHYFLGNSRRFYMLMDPGKCIGLIGFLISIGYVVYQIAVL